MNDSAEPYLVFQAFGEVAHVILELRPDSVDGYPDLGTSQSRIQRLDEQQLAGVALQESFVERPPLGILALQSSNRIGSAAVFLAWLGLVPLVKRVRHRLPELCNASVLASATPPSRALHCHALALPQPLHEEVEPGVLVQQPLEQVEIGVYPREAANRIGRGMLAPPEHDAVGVVGMVSDDQAMRGRFRLVGRVARECRRQR